MSTALAPRRRIDPARRSRIIDAALDVIAAQGVAGTSHRRVAVVADVPLGSMTYHFSGMDELLAAAFSRFAHEGSDLFRARMGAVTTASEAATAVVDLVRAMDRVPQRELVITHELYTLAAREPAFRAITRDWMARDRVSFERWFDPVTSRLLNALIEGLTLHRALDTEPHDPAVAEEAVRRIVAGGTAR